MFVVRHVELLVAIYHANTHKCCMIHFIMQNVNQSYMVTILKLWDVFEKLNLALICIAGGRYKNY